LERFLAGGIESAMFSVGDRVLVRATLRMLLDDGWVAVDLPTHGARVQVRPARRVALGQFLEMHGTVILAL
jgi:hypothetical protein